MRFAIEESVYTYTGIKRARSENTGRMLPTVKSNVDAPRTKIKYRRGGRKLIVISFHPLFSSPSFPQSETGNTFLKRHIDRLLRTKIFVNRFKFFNNIMKSGTFHASYITIFQILFHTR